MLAHDPERLHTASMTNVLIRDVPDDVHGELLRRAEAAGQSLQQYLRAELARLVSRPTMAEILDRLDAEASATIGFADTLEQRDQARRERDEKTDGGR